MVRAFAKRAFMALRTVTAHAIHRNACHGRCRSCAPPPVLQRRSSLSSWLVNGLFSFGERAHSPTKKEDIMATNQKPLHQIRIGAVRASIWEQRSDNSSFLTVSYSRSYRDRQGQWHNGHSYTEQDLSAIRDCALEARKWMRLYRQSNGRAA